LIYRDLVMFCGPVACE